MPQSFIFTRIVPMYSNLIKSYITDFYKFGKGLQSIDEYVKKVVICLFLVLIAKGN